MTSVAKQIDARMKARNLSIMVLEKQSGLHTHAVRNILRGKSKRPSAHNLQAIADVLKCSVKELLSPPPTIEEDNQNKNPEILLKMKYESSTLMQECIICINDYLKEKQLNITNEQFLSCVNEIYLRSLQVNSSRVNRSFAEWFIDLLEE